MDNIYPGDHVIIKYTNHKGLIVKDSTFYRILDLNTNILIDKMFSNTKEIEQYIVQS